MGMRQAFAQYHFFIEVEGIATALFREVSGIGSEHAVVENREGNKKGENNVFKQPGTLKWTDVTCKRGVTDNMELWNWRKKIEDGKVDSERKNMSIALYNQANEELARWNFLNCWPSKITGPQVNANGTDIATEEMVIVHEGMSRVK